VVCQLRVDIHRHRSAGWKRNRTEDDVGLSLPDEVRAALRDEGISEDEMMLMTGDELRQVIGGELTYELAVSLAGQRRAFANYPGREGRVPQDDLIERNLDILKLRIVDGLTYAAIAREVGLSKSRPRQILRWQFGVDWERS
jgi:Sigma-70, region 4